MSHLPYRERLHSVGYGRAIGPAFEQAGGNIGLCTLELHERQATVSKFKRASQVAANAGLDDAHPRLIDSFASILTAVDQPGQAQTIEVARSETAVAGRAALHRRQ